MARPTHVSIRNNRDYPLPVRMAGMVDRRGAGYQLREAIGQRVLNPGLNRNVPLEVLARMGEHRIWRAYFEKGSHAKDKAVLELEEPEGRDFATFIAAELPGSPGTKGRSTEPLPWHPNARVAELRAAADSRGIKDADTLKKAELLEALEAFEAKAAEQQREQVKLQELAKQADRERTAQGEKHQAARNRRRDPNTSNYGPDKDTVVEVDGSVREVAPKK